MAGVAGLSSGGDVMNHESTFRICAKRRKSSYIPYQRTVPSHADRFTVV